MKRILLSLLTILMLSGVAKAQRTITVANGSATSSYVPIYGMYSDAYLRCQTIYPEELISEMTGGTILGLTYFLSSPASDAVGSTFEIKIGIANQSSFTNSAFLSNTNFSTVYTGLINFTTQTCNITFATPYLYEGGNLVIEVNCVDPDDYSSASFYGISQTGGSTQGYSYSSWNSVSGTIRDFIPKTEFSFQEGDVSCPTPTMNAPTVDGTDVTINWTENGTATSYAVYLNNVQTEIVNNTTSYTFHNLNYITTYSAKVRAICAPGDTSYGSSRSFTTPCGTEPLPYNEGFERFTSGSSNFPDCWTNNYGTNYVQSGTSYVASGSNALHIGGPGIVITPPLATNGRPIEVFFSARCESTSSSGSIQVGFTNDASNINNVQWQPAIQPTDNAYHEYEASFESTGSTSTGYVVFKQQASSTIYYYWIDDIYIGVMSDCRKPVDLTVYNVARRGASIGWTVPEGGAPDAYLFEYKNTGSNTWISERVSENYYFITGLTMGTQYDVRVRSICGSDTSRDVSTRFTTPACDVEISGGSTSNSYVPFYSTYNYGYSQMIYPASQLTQLDTIFGIEFNLSSTNTKTYKFDVYIANTSTSSVSTSSIVPLQDLTRVVTNRQMTFNQGWTQISFDTPFIYDGSSNLVIAFDNNTGSYSGGVSFIHHSAAVGNSCYWYQDSGDIQPSSPSASSSNNVSTVPNIKFIVPCTEDECRAPLIAPGTVGSHEVELHWQPMSNENSWTVEYKLLSDQNWTTATENATTTTYTVQNLNAGVNYQFRVSANCNGNHNNSIITVFTKCDLFNVTYTEDFSSGSINPCWATSSGNYPSVVGAKLYTGTQGGTWVILPEFTHPVNTLMMTLKANSTAEGNSLAIGVTNGHDINSFEEIGTYEYQETPTRIEEFFDTYTGTGNNIAIKFLDGNTQVDDIVVSLAPACRRPTNIRVETAEATSATISWDAGPNAQGASVRYHRVNARWTTVTTDENSITLTDLMPNSTYEVIVIANCGDNGNSESSDSFTFRTFCADGSMNVTETYPYVEDFENGLYCWQQEFIEHELDWVTQRGDGESNIGAHGIDTAYEGRLNAVLYNLLVYTSGPKTRIISPVLNTEPLVEPYLKFSYGLTSYIDREYGTTYTDELSVYYRPNANAAWVPLKTYNTATTGWVRDSVALQTTSNTFQISFVGYFKGGNGVALDDIRVYTLGHDVRIDDGPTYTGIDDIDQESERFNVAIYPNPASGSTTVQIDGANGALTVAVMDMSGRTIKTEQVYCNSGCTHQVNLSGLAQGAYFVRVTGDQVNTVRKLIVK